MEHQTHERFKGSPVNKASASQVVDLEAIIRDIVARQIAEVALARRTNPTKDARTCPCCAIAFATLHGRENGRQRFLCSNSACHRTYDILTGTPMARARKPEKWGQYLRYMNDLMSVRKIILAGIGVNHVTVCRWRHRFLKIAIEDQAGVLSGVIEGDKTFVVRSFKGHRGWKRAKPPENRAARPSAWGAVRRGLSSGQVSMLTALDTNGGVYWRVLGGMGQIEAALAGRIAPGSVRCSDRAQAYLRAAKAAGAEHRRIVMPTITPHAVQPNPAIQATSQRRGGHVEGLGSTASGGLAIYPAAEAWGPELERPRERNKTALRRVI